MVWRTGKWRFICVFGLRFRNPVALLSRFLVGIQKGSVVGVCCAAATLTGSLESQSGTVVQY